MKLLGKDISAAKVMALVEERLAARGLSAPRPTDLTPEGVEARVDPLSFNLSAMEDNSDATRGLPLETHRDGVSGRAVMLAKQVFRRVGQVFINEALGRQVVFNGHVRDSYAQLSAEVLRLRQRVAELEAQKATRVEAPPAAPVLPAAVKPLPPPPPPLPVVKTAPTAKVSSAPKVAKVSTGSKAPKAKRAPPPPPLPSAPRARNTRRGK